MAVVHWLNYMQLLETRQNDFDDRCDAVRAEAARAFAAGIAKNQNPYANDRNFAKVWTGGWAEAAMEAIDRDARHDLAT